MGAIPQIPLSAYGCCMDAAAWVKAVRERAGLTQEEFAESVRSNRVTVANWERGKFAPDFPSVTQIVRAFPFAAQMLAGEEPRALAPVLRNLETREIAHVVDTLPRDLRVYVRDMVYRVLGERKAKPPA